MKKAILLLTVVFFALSVSFFAGCGKSQKVNGVSDEQSQVMQEGQEAQQEELPTTYVVEEGDTLWGIAEKADIYGNKYQWPLIYDANRDILDSYETLDEGQKLIIPRNVSAVEIEAAANRARELGLPPAAKTAYAETEDEDSISSGSVAGLGRDSDMETASRQAADRIESESETAMGSEEDMSMPTPVPEPVKKAKAPKKGMNNGIMLMLLLLIGGAIAIYMYFRKKKKEEEDETEGKDDNNILN
jgi:hypothetical protein